MTVSPPTSRPETISVVIPCYNGSQYILPAIRSVLDQGWPTLEVVVVDDGSSDGSAELVRDAFPAVRVVVQANQGVAAARNNGIAQTTGEWVAFLDADDAWLPGKLARQMAAAHAQPDAQLIYSAWSVWESDGVEPSQHLISELAAVPDDAPQWAGPTGWIYPDLLLGCAVWTSTVLVRRNLLERIGGFVTSLRIGEDYDLWLRASRVTPIIRVARPLALYRQHSTNITRSVPRENFRALVVERAIAQWGYGDGQGRQASVRVVHRSLGRCWSEFAEANLGVRRLWTAIRACARAIRLNARDPAPWKILVKCAVGAVPLRRGS